MKLRGRMMMTAGVALLVAIGALLSVTNSGTAWSSGTSERAASVTRPQTGEPAARASAAALASGKADTSRPVVYLTFDDGPSKWTPQVLDILAKERVKATFFVLGQEAERRESTVKRVVREGHALGNHTYNHRYEELYRDFEGFWRQARQTDAILERIAGKPVSLLRAPGGTYGNFDAHYFELLEQAGYRIADWNVDSGDSRRKNVPASEIVKTVKASTLAREVTVLMHDGAGHGESVKALPAIIAYYKAKGYRFAVLDGEAKLATFRLGPDKWQRTWTAAALARAEQLAGERSGGWRPLRDWLRDKGTVAWDGLRKEAVVRVGGETLRLVPGEDRTVRAYGALPGDGGSLAFRLVGERIFVLAA
ncbi:polysaccharide deacetylase family protein [Paenibacillus methanolicus]|uniref:Peptidoglycan/xylan/chitin deacetylase (PgdA/CDA1 family) n=1 Tax=Paenibacillus methanolicus TaxID=582686 RepID=A0A5S5BR70_9BACL|nr:polysaccharide deacetylase family protein [Paenibacillus methanolicus]TYP68073.1 peptidoglycan/xylan/chitin deacetylase (PgdA/CDA1 family) [Paenibacillus methanolicus]